MDTVGSLIVGVGRVFSVGFDVGLQPGLVVGAKPELLPLPLYPFLFLPEPFLLQPFPLALVLFVLNVELPQGELRLNLRRRVIGLHPGRHLVRGARPAAGGPRVRRISAPSRSPRAEAA